MKGLRQTSAWWMIAMAAGLVFPGRILGISPSITDTLSIRNRPGFTSTVVVPDVSPAALFQWLRSMDEERFRDWHPAHREYRVLKETPDYIGSRFYFYEVIAGFKIRGSWEVMVADPPRMFLFKRRWQPIYWLLSLDSVPDGTRVVNEMRYGTGWAWLDRLLIPLVERWVLTPEIQKAIDEHDQEEFRMLSELLGGNNGS